jgi:hypothetical protein
MYSQTYHNVVVLIPLNGVQHRRIDWLLRWLGWQVRHTHLSPQQVPLQVHSLARIVVGSLLHDDVVLINCVVIISRICKENLVFLNDSLIFI